MMFKYTAGRWRGRLAAGMAMVVLLPLSAVSCATSEKEDLPQKRTVRSPVVAADVSANVNNHSVPHHSVGQWVDGLAEYSVHDIRMHKYQGLPIWCVYRCGVYDITDALRADQTFVAAFPPATWGSDAEPFISILRRPQAQYVLSRLEDLRIGNVNHWDTLLVNRNEELRRLLENDEDELNRLKKLSIPSRAYNYGKRLLFPDLNEIRTQRAMERATHIIAKETEDVVREYNLGGNPSTDPRQRERTLTESERMWLQWRNEMDTKGGNMFTNEKTEADENHP